MQVGTLISSDAELVIISECGKEGETLQRLSRIAYTNVRCTQTHLLCINIHVHMYIMCMYTYMYIYIYMYT